MNETEMRVVHLRCEYGVVETQYGETEPGPLFDSYEEAELFAQEERGEQVVVRLVSDWESVTNAGE